MHQNIEGLIKKVWCIGFENVEICIMNWKRGFRRIVFVFGIFAAIICAWLSVKSVLLASSNAHKSLWWAKESYNQKYGMLNQSKVKPTPPEGFVLDKEPSVSHGRFDDLVQEVKQEEAAEIKKLENSFWITLPAWGLIGLCGLAGLLATAIGFSAVWLVYKLLEWLVLGFCGDTG